MSDQGYLTYEEVLAAMLDCVRQIILLHQFENSGDVRSIVECFKDYVVAQTLDVTSE